MIVDDRRVIVRVFLPYSIYRFLIFCSSDGLGELERP